MAWVEVGIKDETFRRDRNGLGRGTRVYFAIADANITTDEGLTASHGGVTVAAEGTAFSASRPTCRAVAHAVRRIDKQKLEVTVEFEDVEIVAFEPEEDLLARAAVVVEDEEQFMKEYVWDSSQPPVAVRNAAGEPFDRGPEKLDGNTVYTITKFVTSDTRATIRNKRRTTNISAVTIDGYLHDEETLFLAGARFVPVIPNDTEGVATIWQATMVVKYRVDGWTDRSLNVGYSELVGGERKDITQKDADDQDVPIPKPWPLNSDGTKKASPTDDPDELVFFPYSFSNWAGLPLV